MRKVAIISDSTSDLSPELKERYHIGIFPLHIQVFLSLEPLDYQGSLPLQLLIVSVFIP